MSKEQNLSPPQSPPVKNSNSLGNTVSSLPPLPDDFLSFQPQPSIHNSINVDDNVLANNSPYSIKQEQQGSYRRGGNSNTRYYRGQKRGSYSQHYDGYSPSTRREKNFGFGGGGGGRGGRNGGYGTPKGGQQRRGEWNTSPKVII
jgi:hypothetical protein